MHREKIWEHGLAQKQTRLHDSFNSWVLERCMKYLFSHRYYTLFLRKTKHFRHSSNVHELLNIQTDFEIWLWIMDLVAAIWKKLSCEMQKLRRNWKNLSTWLQQIVGKNRFVIIYLPQCNATYECVNRLEKV